MGDRMGVQLLLREIYLSLTNHSWPTQPGNPFVGRHHGDALRLGVKADMVLFVGNTV